MDQYNFPKLIMIMSALGVAVGLLFHFAGSSCTSEGCRSFFGNTVFSGLAVGLLAPIGLVFSKKNNR